MPPLEFDEIELVLRPRRRWVALAVVVPVVAAGVFAVVGLAGSHAAFGDLVLAVPFLAGWLYLVQRWARSRVVVHDGVARSQMIVSSDAVVLGEIASVRVVRGGSGAHDLVVAAPGGHSITICPWMWERSDEWEAVVGLAVADREVDASPQVRDRLRAAAARS